MILIPIRFVKHYFFDGYKPTSEEINALVAKIVTNAKEKLKEIKKEEASIALAKQSFRQMNRQDNQMIITGRIQKSY